ncbi:MAG TPA: GntR family transcriptional regulator [Solirubrobacteraceae bacterium]|nr:GntR family transcriptional regulator [Solirubrobacteraceae bacterium]
MDLQLSPPPGTGTSAEGSRVPKYYRLKQELLKQIDALAPGEALPSERVLAAQYETSRTTVRQAFQELVIEGRLQRVHGSGTYVSPPKIAQALQLTSYTEDMRAKGIEPSSRLLDVRQLRADALLAEKLQIATGDRVVRIERLRMADGEPRAIEATHLSAARFPRLRQHLLKVGSLYRTLAEVYGIELGSAEETIETTLARPDEAALLETDVGLPMLMLSRHSFDTAGIPVEWARSVYRGDRYKFVAWLQRPDANGNGTASMVIVGRGPLDQP